MFDELMFNVCDIKRQVENTLKDTDRDIAGNMNEDNRKGYDFGVTTVLNILEQVIEIGESDDYILVNKTGIDKKINYEECDLNDLLESFNARVSASII